MEVTQLRRSTTLKLPRTSSHNSHGSSSTHFPTPPRVGVVLFPSLTSFSFFHLSCYRQPFFNPSFLRSIFLRSRPASFPTIGISTPLTDAIPHHCCRLHSYIRINDCTSILVFTVLQHPNYHYSEYKQETCEGTFPSRISNIRPKCSLIPTLPSLRRSWGTIPDSTKFTFVLFPMLLALWNGSPSSSYRQNHLLPYSLQVPQFV